MKVSEAIARILKLEGIDVIFGYPRNAVLETAAAEGIRPIIVRQERTGLHMADAYSRLSRGKRLGVFAMQHGPGTENAYGAVAQAWSESVPVLVLPQGYARHLAHVPGNYNATVSMRDITKTAEPILRAQDTAAARRRPCSPPGRRRFPCASRGLADAATMPRLAAATAISAVPADTQPCSQKTSRLARPAGPCVRPGAAAVTAALPDAARPDRRGPDDIQHNPER